MLEEWKIMVDYPLSISYTKYQDKTFDEWVDEAIALLAKVEENVKEFV